ncbi:hypothetical protein OEA41_008881 [Lepraria neglecta]|uniref:Protein kinase domain-containing protein n=1 Tax=Lepraria neglecta TaxID=209136 RepID=A0AAE0DJP9_9LECA|nr:hypothetical protein OEA41_008881 [Lepraria neglecta]
MTGGAESEVSERILCIESHWKRTSLQLDFLRRVWQSLDAEYQTIQKQILHVLVSKLTIAISKIDSLIGGSVKDRRQQLTGVKRWRYVLLKEGLDSTIKDLEMWQKMFDPSWFLILMTSSPQIDTELTRHNETSAPSLLNSTQTLRNSLRGNAHQEGSIFLPEDGLRSAHILNIPFSSSKVAQRAGSSKLFILDTVPCPAQGNVQRLTADVRELARKLFHADPIQFGLLKCYGVVRELTPQGARQMFFTLVFRAVEGLSVPQSLRASLLAGEANHSLSDRLDIAKDLAKSISFVHTFGFVHKNVRPETILVSTDKPSSLGHSFLVGFEEFRNAEGHTLRFGDSAWEKNLYRHPRRQGPGPNDYYIMQHDIYSLGVCLLEVGMWESFVFYNEDGTCVPSPTLGALSEGSSVWEPVLVKDLLVSLAQAVLPKRMGTKFAMVVETCLTCLDEDNADFGDEREFQDADGVLVGVRYIEKVRVVVKPYPTSKITYTSRCFWNSKTSQCNSA